MSGAARRCAGRAHAREQQRHGVHQGGEDEREHDLVLIPVSSCVKVEVAQKLVHDEHVVEGDDLGCARPREGCWHHAARGRARSPRALTRDVLPNSVFSKAACALTVGQLSSKYFTATRLPSASSTSRFFTSGISVSSR